MIFPNKSKVFLIFFLLLIFHKNSIANECLIKKELNIGFIENNYIDYKYYLYYALGEYSLINDVEFTIQVRPRYIEGIKYGKGGEIGFLFPKIM